MTTRPIKVRHSRFGGWDLLCLLCSDLWPFDDHRAAVRTAHQHATWHRHTDRHRR